MIAIINLTPHQVVVMRAEGDQITFPAAGPVARIRETIGPGAWLTTEGGRVPVHQIAYANKVSGLPDPSPGVRYLVSRVTAAAVRRDDLVFPQGEIRDDNGQIIGCRALGTFADPTSLIGVD